MPCGPAGLSRILTKIIGKVLAYLAALPDVTEVNDLHIWPVKHD
jgi:hypothetical protein